MKAGLKKAMVITFYDVFNLHLDMPSTKRKFKGDSEVQLDKRVMLQEKPNVRLSDIAGLEPAKHV